MTNLLLVFDHNNLIYVSNYNPFSFRWSLIAEKLPGRTDHEIKNYWHSYLKKSSKINEIKFSDQLNQMSCDSNVEENIETNNFETPETPSSNAGKDCLYILESSTILPMSTETSTGDNYLPTLENCPRTEEDDVAPWLTFEEFSGDFWTEPCILEDTYITNNEISNDEIDIDLFLQDFFDCSYSYAF